MSVNYAENLSPYPNKGICGLPEKLDSIEEVQRKVLELVAVIRNSNHTVVHTGAGVSTAAGIPDFRGPRGVWTLEKQGLKPNVNITFNDAQPTVTHRSLVELERVDYIQYVVTQNIDGLHLRSGFPRDRLSELHGNMFIEECNTCGKRYVSDESVTTMGKKSVGKKCTETKRNGRKCRGLLIDTILDWEDSLPDRDLELAHFHSAHANVSLCLGTSLRIVPAADLPLLTRKRSAGKLIIVNLQDTKHERHCDLHIYARVEDVMTMVMDELGLEVPEFTGIRIVNESHNTLPCHLRYDDVRAEEKKLAKLQKSDRKKRKIEYKDTQPKIENKESQLEESKIQNKESQLEESEIEHKESQLEESEIENKEFQLEESKIENKEFQLEESKIENKEFQLEESKIENQDLQLEETKMENNELQLENKELQLEEFKIGNKASQSEKSEIESKGSQQ